MTVRRASPWISQLERRRPVVALEGNEAADTVVAGGGIAGLATAFFVLRDTDRDVVLLEQGLVAHGATGHNAGQAVAALEGWFDEMAAELGEAEVMQGYREVLSGWDRLQDILTRLERPGDLLRVEGKVALSTPEAVRSLMNERAKWIAAGAPHMAMAVVKGALSDLPEGVKEVSEGEMMRVLRTIDRRYIAAVCMASGVLNAAVLTEALAEHLLVAYPKRFRLFERSAVRRARLGDEVAVTTDRGTVHGDNMVLCTNGYTGIEMQACEAPVYQGNVKGVVGFMVGRFGDGPDGAEAFFRGAEHGYYYLTRRQYAGRPFICIGGPEEELGADERYDAAKDYDPQAYEHIDAFARETLGDRDGWDMEWHGLMGYTPGGARLVGADPGSPSLLYNLGCNGIGLLASLAGGWKVAQLMRGTLFPHSMFDPSRLARDRIMRIV